MVETDIGRQQAQLEASVSSVIQQAKELGADQVEASASAGSGLSVTVRKQATETLEYHRDQGLSVTVYAGGRKGNASTSDISEASLRETVAKAVALAGYGAPDEAAGLADAERMATEFPDLQLFFPWALGADEAIDLAQECEAAALDCDSRITNSEGATVSSHEGCRVYGNSHGFLAGYPDSQHSLSCAVLASSGSDMQRDYEYTVARDPGELAGPQIVGREAGERTVCPVGRTQT